MHRMKLCLPYLLDKQLDNRSSDIKTWLLATILDCLTKRKVQQEDLRMLVIDNLDDTSIIEIFQSHGDMKNALKVFSKIQELCITINLQEWTEARQSYFNHCLWHLFSCCADLRSLSLRNAKRGTQFIDTGSRIVHRNSRPPTFSLSGNSSTCRWKFLRHLEFKGIVVGPTEFLELFKEIKDSIREVHLNCVDLRIHSGEKRNRYLWIGLSDIEKQPDMIWMAEDLRNIGLKLDVLCVSGLGYDYVATHYYLDLDFRNNFDISDSLEDMERSFDQRFIEAYFEFGNSEDQLVGSRMAVISGEEIGEIVRDHRYFRETDHFDRGTYMLKRKNHSSCFWHRIDEIFIKSSIQGGRKLQSIADEKARVIGL
ncbi:hypothetical protein K3495_g1789 [Podosphaera aphanis]|nr:hypothetical protein K3495_g1789 [Podosphaera aphanis]